MRMCSMYLDFGGASCVGGLVRSKAVVEVGERTLIFVAPFTDFSKELDMAVGRDCEVQLVNVV